MEVASSLDITFRMPYSTPSQRASKYATITHLFDAEGMSRPFVESFVSECERQVYVNGNAVTPKPDLLIDCLTKNVKPGILALMQNR